MVYFSQEPPKLQLNISMDVKDGFEQEDMEIANEPAVPMLWGMQLKYISLVTLAIQNSVLTIVMHYSRVSTPPSRTYNAATAVLLNEVLKCAISSVVAFTRVGVSSNASYTTLDGQPQSGWFLVTRARKLWREIFSQDCWKLSIPAILYVIQNNLQFVAVSNLDAATFQVTYQMKILTTAAFSVLLLGKRLLPTQWIALLCLAIGVGIVQIQAGSGGHTAAAVVTAVADDVHRMNPLKGFLAVSAACFTSGVAGVYFEMVLKNSACDLWVRNIQLSLFSLVPALVPVVFNHATDATAESGFFGSLFRNFGGWAWATVLIQVAGGLITALVIKYSDNILKGFATSLAIVISFVASVIIFNFKLTPTFVLGCSIVLAATWLYNQPPRTFLWRDAAAGSTNSHARPFALPFRPSAGRTLSAASLMALSPIKP